MTNVKIYALINSLNDAVFYIGCTKQSLKARLSGHVNSTVKSRKSDYIYDVCCKGGRIEMIELHEADISEGKFWEQHHIDLFRSFGFELIQRRTSEYDETVRNRFRGTYSWSKKGRSIIEANPELKGERRLTA